MKKILSVVLLTVLSTVSFAQNPVGRFTVYPKLGVNLAQMSEAEFYVEGSDYVTTTQMKQGFTGGVEVAYQVIQPLSVSVAAMFSNQGVKYKDFSMSTDDTFESWSDVAYSMNYLNLPFMANLYVTKGLALKVGVQVGFLMQSQFRSRVEYGKKVGEMWQTTVETTKMNTKDIFNTVDFSLPIGISYEYKNIVLEARYTIGLSNLYKVDNELSTRHQMLTFTLGYGFDL